MSFMDNTRNELFKIFRCDRNIVDLDRFVTDDKHITYYYDQAANSQILHMKYILQMTVKRKNFIFSLDTILFNKIWSKQIPTRVKTRDTTLYYPANFYLIGLNPNGDYVKLLDNLGKSNRYYKKVHEGIICSGTLSPVFYAGFFNHEYSFDFKNISDRLFFSIALLTLDEPIEKKVERYLKKSSAHNKG